MEIKHYFHYDDRYFQNTRHTREELYWLQSLIMDTTFSLDLAKDISNLGNYEEQEIETALKMYFKEGKIQRERIGMDGDRPIYRYYKK